MLLLEKLVFLLEDEQVVLLHGVEFAIDDVLHEFDLGVGSLPDLLQFEVLVDQLTLSYSLPTSGVTFRTTLSVSGTPSINSYQSIMKRINHRRHRFLLTIFAIGLPTVA